MNREELGFDNQPPEEIKKQKREIFEFFGFYNSLADAQKISPYQEVHNTDTMREKIARQKMMAKERQLFLEEKNNVINELKKDPKWNNLNIELVFELNSLLFSCTETQPKFHSLFTTDNNQQGIVFHSHFPGLFLGHKQTSLFCEPNLERKTIAAKIKIDFEHERGENNFFYNIEPLESFIKKLLNLNNLHLEFSRDHPEGMTMGGKPAFYPSIKIEADLTNQEDLLKIINAIKLSEGIRKSFEEEIEKRVQDLHRSNRELDNFNTEEEMERTIEILDIREHVIEKSYSQIIKYLSEHQRCNFLKNADALPERINIEATINNMEFTTRISLDVPKNIKSNSPEDWEIILAPIRLPSELSELKFDNFITKINKYPYGYNNEKDFKEITINLNESIIITCPAFSDQTYFNEKKRQLQKWIKDNQGRIYNKKTKKGNF